MNGDETRVTSAATTTHDRARLFLYSRNCIQYPEEFSSSSTDVALFSLTLPRSHTVIQLPGILTIDCAHRHTT